MAAAENSRDNSGEGGGVKLDCASDQRNEHETGHRNVNVEPRVKDGRKHKAKHKRDDR
jgi:hypothetical protein